MYCLSTNYSLNSKNYVPSLEIIFEKCMKKTKNYVKFANDF